MLYKITRLSYNLGALFISPSVTMGKGASELIEQHLKIGTDEMTVADFEAELSRRWPQETHSYYITIRRGVWVLTIFPTAPGPSSIVITGGTLSEVAQTVKKRGVE